MKRLAFAGLLAGFAAVLAFAPAVHAAENSRLVIRSTGTFEDSNVVVYNIYLATRDEKLTDLQVSTAVPGASRFLENVDTPAGVKFDGVYDNVVRWTVPALDRDTLLGPFTVRIRVDASRSDIPTTPPVWASCPAERCEFLLDPGDSSSLKTLASTISISFDQRGTLNAQGRNGLVEAADGAVFLYVPEGAVDRRVTLTFRRLTVEDDKVPQNAKDTWWCALFNLSIEPAVSFAKPIVYSFPTRRGLTPGLAVRAFASADGKAWQEISAPPATAPSKEAATFPQGLGNFGGFGTTCTTIPLNVLVCSSTGQLLGGLGQFGGGLGGGIGGIGAFGVDQTTRIAGTITATALTTQFGVPFRPSQIQDGTSNIIAILIGIR